MMRTKEQIQEEIRVLQEELDNLPKGRWRAEAGEDYWFIREDDVFWTIEDGCRFDDSRYALGNCFKTEEEAQKEARHREFEQKVTARFDDLNGERLWINLKSSTTYQIRICSVSKIVFSENSDDLLSHRNWVSREKKIADQIIQEFGPENFLKWAQGEL